MTPVFLSPPSSSFSLVEKQEDQKLKLIISPYQDQKATDVTESQQRDPKAVDNPMWYQESNNNQVRLLSSSSSSSHNQPVEIDVASHNKLSNCSQRSDHIVVDKINGEDRDDQDHMSKIVTSMNYDNKRSTSVKWMSSKMRLIQKMSNDPQTAAATTLTDHNSDSHNAINCTGTSSTSSTVRVCSDCNTTSTPLWRSGPRGPKSLCNACGIRQRKARRAMAEAAVVTSATATSTTSYKIKEKKHWRGNLNKNINKYSSKLLDTTTTSTTSSSHNSKSDQRNNHNNNNKLCFRNLSFELNHNYNYSAFPGVFSQDVTEAALLLMELSCGFVHS